MRDRIMGAQILIEKIWRRHIVKDLGDGRALVHIDRHLIHEGTTRPAFDGLRQRGIPVHRPDLTYAVVDHGVATSPGRTADTYEPTRNRTLAMRRNCAEFGIELMDISNPRQGIVHVIAPELGITLPGTTVVCGDSHTATSGGLGAWAWGIGTTEVQQALATQSLIQAAPACLCIWMRGALGPGVTPKDIILNLIGKVGTAAAAGKVIEYAGPTIRSLSIEGRLTICNMSIELGARSGLIAPDDGTFEYLSGRPFAPAGAMWDRALVEWRNLVSDENARYADRIDLDVSAVAPQITWGNSPQDVIGVDERVPSPEDAATPAARDSVIKALDYMRLQAGQTLEGLPIEVAFIGSCTNGRLSDLQSAAKILRGRKVAPGVRALVVPGSTQVKREAEALGLDEIFKQAGFEWRESGCSMCVATNGDVLQRGQRSISTTNRNFENRQGPGSRTHLASPAMVAAAAVNGRVTDVRKWLRK
jgi:3-isopropylmalate/(R)-2-methylmalate dehydratase large subunit